MEKFFSNKKVPLLGTIDLYLYASYCKKKTLKEYYEKNIDSKQPLLFWYKEISSGSWKNHNEIKKSFNNLSVLPRERIVFNIKGNKYRIVAKVNYDFQIIWIRFVGTHSDYDKIDATTI